MVKKLTPLTKTILLFLLVILVTIRNIVKIFSNSYVLINVGFHTRNISLLIFIFSLIIGTIFIYALFFIMTYKLINKHHNK